MSNHTATEKILARACGKKEVFPGEIITADIDLVFAHTIQRHYDPFEAIGGVKGVFDPEKVVFGLGHHLFSSADRGTAKLYKRVRDLNKKYGVKHVYDFGSGIGHYLVIEKGHVWPGAVAVGADSHTTAYGAIGAFSTPANYEVTEVLLSGKLWFKVPETLNIRIEGTPGRGVLARDVAQHVIGIMGQDSGLWKTIEFTGSYIADLSIQQRVIFSLLAVEMGGMTGFIPPDEKTIEFARKTSRNPNFEVIVDDPKAEFARIEEFDITNLEPKIACPFSPTNTNNVTDVLGKKIDQAFIGGCTGGGLDDLHRAAEIFDGRKCHPDVRLIVVPGTKDIMAQAMADGTMAILHKAGASFYPPYCGPCQMLCVGHLADSEVMIGTHPRNWPGRGGSEGSNEVFLASPYTVAASAVAGEIVDPRDYLKKK